MATAAAYDAVVIGSGVGGLTAARLLAERALFLWNNDYIVSLVAQNRHAVLPIVFAALDRNVQAHWNAAVHGLTCNVRKMFQARERPTPSDGVPCSCFSRRFIRAHFGRLCVACSAESLASCCVMPGD